jgi:hypothetical protein
MATRLLWGRREREIEQILRSDKGQGMCGEGGGKKRSGQADKKGKVKKKEGGSDRKARQKTRQKARRGVRVDETGSGGQRRGENERAMGQKSDERTTEAVGATRNGAEAAGPLIGGSARLSAMAYLSACH